jgi:hypothetical protein
MTVLLVNTFEHGTFTHYNQTRFAWNIPSGGANNSFIVNTVGAQHQTASGVGGIYSLLLDDYYGTVSGVFKCGITAFSDYGGTVPGTVLAASQGHGIDVATDVIIGGTTSYNGTFAVTVVDADSFYFFDTWVADEAPAYADFIPRFLHFWWKPGGNTWGVQFPKNGSQQFEVVGNGSGELKFYRGNFLAQTTVGAFVATVPHWIAIELVAAEAGYCKVYIDEVLAATFVGDTRNGTVDGWDGIGFGIMYSGGFGVGNLGTYIDDIIVTDEATGLLGEQITTVIVPNGDALPNDLIAMSGAGAGTPTLGDNFATVDEVPFSDNDWNGATAIGQTDRYEMTTVPGAITAVTLVQLTARASRDGAITKGEVSVDSGGTISHGAVTQLPASPGYLNIPFIMTRDPDTGLAWTPTAIGFLKAGLRFS